MSKINLLLTDRKKSYIFLVKFYTHHKKVLCSVAKKLCRPTKQNSWSSDEYHNLNFGYRHAHISHWH